MAIMYPERPKEFSINSKEDLMFEALSNLPDTYYIFHSYRTSVLNQFHLHYMEISQKCSKASL